MFLNLINYKLKISLEIPTKIIRIDVALKLDHNSGSQHETLQASLRIE